MWGSDLGPSLDRHTCLRGGSIRGVPRKVKFNGWNQFFFVKKNIQGIPDSQVKTVLGNLEKMTPQEVRTWIYWEQTKIYQGPRPTKIRVSLWFKHDTGLILMFEILKLMTEELEEVIGDLTGEGEAYVMGLRHECRSTESLGKRLLFLLDNMALVLGASKCSSSMPNLNHTCREICVISLDTFIIPICRWIASEANPADDPSRSKRYRPSMNSDVDQCRPSATGSAPDAELLAVLSAEATRVASEETQTRKQSANRSCAGVTNHKSRKDGSRFAGDAKKKNGHELEHTSPRRVWLVSIPSSASRPSSSRTESPRLRSNVTRPRSTSSWPLQKCCWTSWSYWQSWTRWRSRCWNTCTFKGRVTELEIT